MVCLGVENQMKTFMGIPAHPGTADGLFNIIQLYQGHLSEAAFPLDDSACFPQSAGFLSCFLPLLGSIHTKAESFVSS